METVYLVVLSMIIVGGSFLYLPFFMLLIEIGLIFLIIFFYNRKMSFIVLGIILVFSLNMMRSTDKEKHNVGDIITISGRVENGRGKIEKIDGKIPINREYFLVDNVEDGDYEISGEIEEWNFSKYGESFKINPIYLDKKENILQEYFLGKVEKMTEKYGVSLENFVKSIILNEGELLDFGLKEKFRYTGTSHLLVISGLHISVIVGLIFYLLKKIKIKKEIRSGITIFILSLYVFSIGITPSILRAYIMGVIFLLGNILYEKTDIGKSLGVAFIVSILFFPQWLYSLSFIMSYLAVFAIAFIYPKIPKIEKDTWYKEIGNTLVLTIIIQITLAPVQYIYFSTIPLLSFFTNLLLIPLGSLFVVLAFLTLMLSNIYLEFLLAPMLDFTYRFFIFSVEILSEIPYLTLEI